MKRNKQTLLGLWLRRERVRLHENQNYRQEVTYRSSKPLLASNILEYRNGKLLASGAFDRMALETQPPGLGSVGKSGSIVVVRPSLGAE